MAAQPHVIIRTDGGPVRGLGHLVRQTLLATALCEQGASVTFLCTEPWPSTLPRPLGMSYGHYAPARARVSLLEWATVPNTLVVLDSPEGDPELVTQLMTVCPVAQVEPREAEAAGHLVVLPNLHQRWTGTTRPPVIEGREAVLLDPALGRRSRVPQAKRQPYLVITAGGGNPLPVLHEVAAVARDYPWGKHAVLLIPPGTPWGACYLRSPVRWRVWHPSWLFEAQMAVIPLGQTLLETLYAWTPTLTWARTAADHALLPHLHRYGVVTAVEPQPWAGGGQRWGTEIQAWWDNRWWQDGASILAAGLDLPLDGAARLARQCLNLLGDGDVEAH